LPIAIINLVAAYFMLKNITTQTNPKLDVLSIILSTLGFGGILYGFSIAGDLGWMHIQVVLTIVVGSIALFFFIKRQLNLEQPILEFRVFTYGTFALATGLGMIVFAAMIGTSVILPLYMQNILGFSALHSGLVLLPGAILMGLMNPVTGYLFDKLSGKWLARTGLLLLTITTIAFTGLDANTTFTFLATMNAVRMVSISMVMMPMTTLALNQLPEHLIPHGTAMNNTFRQTSGAIGTAILVTVMATAAIPGKDISGIIHGVNVSFIVAAVLAGIGFILSFGIKDDADESKGK